MLLLLLLLHFAYIILYFKAINYHFSSKCVNTIKKIILKMFPSAIALRSWNSKFNWKHSIIAIHQIKRFMPCGHVVLWPFILYANKTDDRYKSQSSLFVLVYFVSTLHNVWLKHSTNLLVCGWYAVDSLCLTPRFLHKEFSISFTKYIPRSVNSSFRHL